MSKENNRWEEEEMCCVFKFSRPVHGNSGGVLTVKLDYVLKGALVDIIPVLIIKNITFYSFLSTKIVMYKFIPNSDLSVNFD